MNIYDYALRYYILSKEIEKNNQKLVVVYKHEEIKEVLKTNDILVHDRLETVKKIENLLGRH